MGHRQYVMVSQQAYGERKTCSNWKGPLKSALAVECSVLTLYVLQIGKESFSSRPQAFSFISIAILISQAHGISNGEQGKENKLLPFNLLNFNVLCPDGRF